MSAELYRRILSRGPETHFLSRNRNRLIARLLPLALLVAQLGAQVHAYSHFGTNPDGIPNSVQTCGTCHSFSPLTMAVGSAHSAVQMDPCNADHGIPAAIAAVLGHTPRSSNQSRAPPQFL